MHDKLKTKLEDADFNIRMKITDIEVELLKAKLTKLTKDNTKGK
jgi:hypothetical protein